MWREFYLQKAWRTFYSSFEEHSTCCDDSLLLIIYSLKVGSLYSYRLMVLKEANLSKKESNPFLLKIIAFLPTVQEMNLIALFLCRIFLLSHSNRFFNCTFVSKDWHTRSPVPPPLFFYETESCCSGRAKKREKICRSFPPHAPSKLFIHPCALKYLLLHNKITWKISLGWKMVEFAKLLLSL